MLKELCNKYGFTLSTDEKLCTGYDENHSPIYEAIPEALCTKNTDGKDVMWLYLYNNRIYCRGNTDHLNIWLHETRPDFTAETIMQFVKDLNQAIKSTNCKFSISHLIDPEDWQEIADVESASDDVRYQ